MVVAIVGPTASGKSLLALDVARATGAEIVAADSATVYRGMDIGTAKPSIAQRDEVPHHMIDVLDPSEDLTVASFQALARSAIDDVLNRGKVPLIVGGSGLYFRAIVDPLEFPATSAKVRTRLQDMAEQVGGDEAHRRLASVDPDSAESIDPRNVRRTVRALEVFELTGKRFSEFRGPWDEYRSIYDLAVVGLAPDKDSMDARIDARVDAMFESGLVAEVERLLEQGYRRSLTSVQALGYHQVLTYLDGGCTLSEAASTTKARTRKFARRQLTWFKADPRVRWFESEAIDVQVRSLGLEGP